MIHYRRWTEQWVSITFSFDRNLALLLITILDTRYEWCTNLVENARVHRRRMGRECAAANAENQHGHA